MSVWWWWKFLGSTVNKCERTAVPRSGPILLTPTACRETSISKDKSFAIFVPATQGLTNWSQVLEKNPLFPLPPTTHISPGRQLPQGEMEPQAKSLPLWGPGSSSSMDGNSCFCLFLVIAAQYSLENHFPTISPCF